jgi:hypothetical protein
LLEFGPKPSDLIPLTHLKPLEPLRASRDPVRSAHLPTDAAGGDFGTQSSLAFPG